MAFINTEPPFDDVRKENNNKHLRENTHDPNRHQSKASLEQLVRGPVMCIGSLVILGSADRGWDVCIQKHTRTLHKPLQFKQNLLASRCLESGHGSHGVKSRCAETHTCLAPRSPAAISSWHDATLTNSELILKASYFLFEGNESVTSRKLWLGSICSQRLHLNCFSVASHRYSCDREKA